MSNTLYRVQNYVRFSADELLSLLLTGVVAAFVLSARDLLFVRYGQAASIQKFVLMLLFVLLIMIVLLTICKIVAIRIGHIITYRAHYLGLALGVVLCILSAGFLPLFLPGGFRFDQPETLRIGKFFGYRKGWETGLIAGSFTLFSLGAILFLSPLYLLSRAEFYAELIVACCLFGLFALIPVPFIDAGPKQWYRRLHGATFGLDVYYASKFWFGTLAAFAVLFSTLAILLTTANTRVGFVLYMFCLALSAFCFYFYPRFFK
jgi:hypothetical protein